MSYQEIYMQYEKIIYNVLRKCHIYPNQLDYEDYAQELRISLIEELKRIESNQLEIKHLGGYLQNFLKWKCYNLLRAAKRHLSVAMEQDFLNQVAEPNDKLDAIDLLASIRSQINCYECELICMLIDGYTTKEIAARLNKNERTVRRYRERVRDKLKAKRVV